MKGISMQPALFDSSRGISRRLSGRLNLSILAAVFIAAIACATEAWAGYSATNLVSDIPIIAVDDGAEGSVYKGAALGESSSGLRLFVTNFSEAKVSIYDENFAEIEDDAAFVDPGIPRSYSPSGIQNINGLIYVTYAKRDA